MSTQLTRINPYRYLFVLEADNEQFEVVSNTEYNAKLALRDYLVMQGRVVILSDIRFVSYSVF